MLQSHGSHRVNVHVIKIEGDVEREKEKPKKALLIVQVVVCSFKQNAKSMSFLHFKGQKADKQKGRRGKQKRRVESERAK